MTEPYPKLLIVRNLVAPIASAREVVTAIRADVHAGLAATLTHGAFVMAVAAVEVALVDSLMYYLRHFPKKLPKEARPIAIDALPTDVVHFIEKAAERFVRDLAYKSLPGFFDRYLKLLSIPATAELADAVALVQEIKATRNVLLHNRGISNDLYVAQAGSKRRAEYEGAKLSVDVAYVHSSADALCTVLDNLAVALASKYSSYTKVAAHRTLWGYVFDSPIMLYDDFWLVDEAADKIVAMKEGASEASISSSERLFLGVWRAHFNGRGDYLKDLHMRRFDKDNLRKFHFMLAIARAFPWS